jgi:RNA polymerase sigma factor (sigma-70 family)
LRVFAKAPEACPALVGRLAGEHADHVRYLRRRFRTSFRPDELDEVVREAYVRALASIEAAAPGDLRFASYDKARGWFREIARHTAIDEIRARDGRRASEKRLRPQVLSLDRFADDQERDDAWDNPALRDPDVDTEEEGLLWSERDHAQQVLAAALERVRPELLRLLRARYLDNLEPDAIQRLEGLSPTQYERQHTRALKALRKALGGLELGRSCKEVRLQLQDHMVGLLDEHALVRRDAHLAGCRPCQLFSLQLRGALAALPLPAVGGFGVVAKLAALVAGRGGEGAAPGAAAFGGAAKGAGVFGTVSAGKAACAVSVLAICATITAGYGGEPSRVDPAGTASSPARPAAPAASTPLSAQQPQRRVLLRRARSQRPEPKRARRRTEPSPATTTTVAAAAAPSGAA